MQTANLQNWYSLEPKTHGVTLIEEPFIKPFYRCNNWHVAGSERDLLVDSGMGVVSLREHVPLVNEKPILAVASHTHFDHIGCHHEFDERFVHHAEADILAHPTRMNTLADLDIDEDVFTRLPPGNYSSDTYAVKPAPATGLLSGGDTIDLGNRSWTVIHTPGHSPGGIGLFEEATGVFIAGDIVYDGPLVEDAYHSNLEDYISSMKRLLELPVSMVHGGHFESFGPERYREIIQTWLRNKGV